MTPTDIAAAVERLTLLADGCAVSGLDHLSVVDRANAEPFATDLRTILAALKAAEGEHSNEYMSVSVTKDGVVTSHNAFNATFDDMVEATRTIIDTLQVRLDNRVNCPFAAGTSLREENLPPVNWKARAETAETQAASLRTEVEGLTGFVRRHACGCASPCERPPEDRDDSCEAHALLQPKESEG